MVPQPVTRRAFVESYGTPLRYIFQGKDADNIWGKTVIMTKWTGITAAFCTMSDVMLRNEPQGVTHAITRAIYYSTPLVGGGLAYMAFTNLAATFRKKDDGRNHLYGGIGAGIVVGAHVKSIHTGIVSSIVIGLIGFAWKELAKEGGDLLGAPPVARRHGFSLTHKTDCTLFPNRPGYWVRTQEEADEIIRTGSREQYHGEIRP